jgi:hypothetical protein
VKVANAATAQILKLVQRVDTGDIDAWFKAHDAEIMRIIVAGWTATRDLSGIYLRDHGVANRSKTLVYQALFRPGAVRTSIQVTGVVRFKNAIAAGKTVEVARRAMLGGLKGSMFRHVYAGGRDTIMETVKRSNTILGFRRISDNDPCAFCAMLISRGAVYTKETAGFEAHDYDQCLPEPLYRKEDEPESVRKLYARWLEVTHGLYGKDAVDAWRAAYTKNPK